MIWLWLKREWQCYWRMRKHVLKRAREIEREEALKHGGEAL